MIKESRTEYFSLLQLTNILACANRQIPSDSYVPFGGDDHADDLSTATCSEKGEGRSGLPGADEGGAVSLAVSDSWDSLDVEGGEKEAGGAQSRRYDRVDRGELCLGDEGGRGEGKGEGKGKTKSGRNQE